MELVKGDVDVQMILETKLNNTFAIDQFALEGCSLGPATLSKKRPNMAKIKVF